MLIDDGYQIPFETLNDTDWLYCIQKGQKIPAIDRESGVKLEATVRAGTGKYAIAIPVWNPQTDDMIGRRFVEGTTQNIYGTSNIRTYSIGRYYESQLTPPKQYLKDGNADEKEAYLLSYYKENNNVNSEDQISMYTTTISNDAYTNIVKTHNKPEKGIDTELSIEADLYSSYRDRVKYNYEPTQYSDNGVEEYWNGDTTDRKIYIGPFKIDYERDFAKVGNRDKVEFNYIESYELYNLDDSLITNHWEFVYTKDRSLRNYDNDYKFPYPNEEFYIKLDYTDDIKGIKYAIIKYRELYADAQYQVLEGTYNTVDWIPNRIYKNSPESMWCTEVEDKGALICSHGQRKNHIIGAWFYLKARIVNPGGLPLESQKLLRLEWVNKWYNQRIETENIQTQVINRERYPAGFYIQKIDGNGNAINKAGAKFNITIDETYLKTYTTNSSGMIKNIDMPKTLGKHVLKIVEINPPDGYERIEEKIEVEFELIEEKETIKIVNQRVKTGTVATIQPLDEDKYTIYIKNNEDKTKESYSKGFNIQKVDANGKLIKQKGTQFEVEFDGTNKSTYTTNTLGIINNINNMPNTNGKHVLKISEINSPEGYEKSLEIIEIEFELKNISGTGKISNILIKNGYRIYVEKKDDETFVVQIGNDLETAIPSTLLKSGFIIQKIDKNGGPIVQQGIQFDVISDGVSKKTYYTNKAGYVEKIEDMPSTLGSHIMQISETVSPEGYKKSNEEIEIKYELVKENGSLKIENPTITASGSKLIKLDEYKYLIEVSNEKDNGQESNRPIIGIQKLDNYGIPISEPGIQFDVLGDEYNYTSYSTNNSGLVEEISQMPVTIGAHTLKIIETKAPLGYKKLIERIEINYEIIKENGILKIKNPVLYGSGARLVKNGENKYLIQVLNEKYDDSDQIGFAIQKIDNNNVPIVEPDVKFEVIKDGKDSKLYSTNKAGFVEKIDEIPLTAGSHTLQIIETQAPSGYKKMTGTIELKYEITKVNGEVNGEVKIKNTELIGAGAKIVKQQENKYLIQIYNQKEGNTFPPFIPSYTLGFDITGNVWNDGNENYTNGLIDTNEKPMEKVIVRAYKINNDGQRVSSTPEQETYTDVDGFYRFNDLPIYYYDIEFEYDGQTYISTKYMVNSQTGQSDTAQDYSKDYQTAMSRKYQRNSKVRETKKQRQELNDRYAEISKFGSIGSNSWPGYPGYISWDNKWTGLEYKMSVGQSNIITLDKLGFSRKQYSIYPWSMSDNLKYPIYDIVTFSFGTLTKVRNQFYVNIGLAEREKTNENLRLDVFESTFTIKGSEQKYIHSQKNIRDINSIEQGPDRYVQKLNKSDYNWKVEQYKDYPNYQEIIDIFVGRKNGTPEEAKEAQELKAYIDYMIVIRKTGDNDIVRISELVDYFDKSLKYSNDGYRDFKDTSWAVVRTDEETEENNSLNNERIILKWDEKSKYADKFNETNEYPEFNKLYTNSLDQEKCQIKVGEYLEVHIVFEVLKDEEEKILYDKDEEVKKNFAEINGYKTFYKEGDTYVSAGLIDFDSRPGNLNPYNNMEAYEDDEDKAPDYKLILDDTKDNNTNGENTGNDFGGTSSDPYSNVDNDDIGNKDENGNLINYGNVIEGNVWEDIRKTREGIDSAPNVLKLKNNQTVADGIRQDNEPLLNRIQAHLIEIIRGEVIDSNGQSEEKETKETVVPLKDKIKRTKEVYSLSNLDEKGDSIKLDGGYRYANLPTGIYKVEFTYGDEEALKDSVIYNGEDYQSILTEEIYDNENIKDDYSNTDVMFVIDDSNSMDNGKLDKAKNAAIRLIDKLQEKLPNIKIGVVVFNEKATLVSKPAYDITTDISEINKLECGGMTSLAQGIKFATEQYNADAKNRVMIIITDGQETVGTNEEVIQELERDIDSNKIRLSTLLTSPSEQIFGTVEKPRRGKLYFIVNDEQIPDIVANNVYDNVAEDSYFKNNRSFGKDLEGNYYCSEDELDKQKGTRTYILKRFERIATKNAELLDIEELKQMEITSNERKQRVAALANETTMKAETKEIKIRANNVEETKAEQVNLSLTLRPEAELEATNKIKGVQVILSDGNVIIDTEKGLNKNVQGLDQKPEVPLIISMDEEIMQGAEIAITYEFKIKNLGEIDRLSNYFVSLKGNKEVGDPTIANYPDVVYNYVNKNLVFRESNQFNKNMWKIIEREDVKDGYKNEYEVEINAQLENSVKKQNITILRNIEGKSKALYPGDSTEVLEKGKNDEWIFYLTLTKMISPNDYEDILSYEDSLEIIQQRNLAGRRGVFGVKGDYIPNSIPKQPDETLSRTIKIIKPLGGNLPNNNILLSSIIVLIVIGTIIIIIKIKLNEDIGNGKAKQKKKDK